MEVLYNYGLNSSGPDLFDWENFNNCFDFNRNYRFVAFLYILYVTFIDAIY